MSNPAVKFTSFALEGDALVAARSMLELTAEIREETSALRDEFDRRYNEAMTRNNVLAKGLWRRIAQSRPEVDPETTWLDGSWYIENSFLKDHGVAFLCRREKEENPLEALVGASEPSKLH